MRPPIVNGVCLSVSPSGVYCDRGEEAHEYHVGARLDAQERRLGSVMWPDGLGTLDPRGQHPPRTCLDGCRHWGGPRVGCAVEMTVKAWLYANRTGSADGWDLGVRPGAPPCPGYERVGVSGG